MRRRRGFTLTELAVAAATGGLVLAAIGSLAHLSGRPSRRAQARLAGVLATQAVEGWLSRDLSMARGLPEVSDDGAALRLPVHPAGAVRYQSLSEGGLVREGRDGVARRLRVAADMAARFEVRLEEGTYRLRVVATPARDVRVMARDGSVDARGVVAVEVQVPDFALDESLALSSWASPAP